MITVGRTSWAPVLLLLLDFAGQDVLAFGLSDTGHRGITKSALGATQRVVDGTTYKFTGDATAEILKANVDTDLDQVTSAKHFDDEAFQAGTQRLRDLKTAVIDNLKSPTPDGAKARADLGTALHTLQDFYAHSNWVELGKTAIESRLGREVFGGLAADVATCPDNPTTLGGEGLTSLTSGYFPLRSLCTPPAGKCRHGADIVFNRCPTGLNKDEPGRPNYQAAYNFAVDASKDFLNQILDAAGVAGNAKATRALMDTKPMLGVLIDGTGSMNDKLAAVKAQVEQIVGDLRGTANEPLRYLLVRFGDPVVGKAFVTADADSFLGRVRGLGATGGGDCPEPAMSATLSGLLASYADARLYLFTDAPPKDPDLTDIVIMLAQLRNTSVTPILLGTCPDPEPAPNAQQSVSVDYSNVDEAYVDLAFETGGDLEFLDAADADDVSHLVEPDLCGSLQHLLLVEGSLGGAGTTYALPVDGTIQSLTVTAHVDSAPSVVLHRPNGSTVGPADPGVTITDLATGREFTLASPEPGDWQLDLSGHGRFAADAVACSPVEFGRFDFEAIAGRPAHQGLFPIPCQPLAGTVQTAVAKLLGSFDDASFVLLGEAGQTLQSISLSQGNVDTDASDFVGSLSPPSQPFRAAVTGTIGDVPYRRVFPELFRAQTVEISAADSIGTLNAGTTTNLSFAVHNEGVPATFRVTASDDQGFVSTDPQFVTLATGATGRVDVPVTVPHATPDGTEVAIAATATSTSDSETDNCVSRTLVVQATVRVEIEDWTAVSVQGGVRLSWRLAATGTYDLTGVQVQRATSAEGPFTTRTAAPLAPAPSMSFEDAGIETGSAYWYRLALVGRNGAETYSTAIRVLSNPDARWRTDLEIVGGPSSSGPIDIRYGVAHTGTRVRLTVFDVAGRRLRVVDEGLRSRGEYLRTWDRLDEAGARAARGVYLVQLTAGDVRISKKLLLLAP
jgi:hypothetical protein